MTWIEYLEAVTNLLTAMATLFGVGFAVYGINAWRREFVGKRKIEVAEDALALFYEVSDAVEAIRSPISSGAETEHIERWEGESDQRFHARKQAAVVYSRYEKRSELFSRWYAMRYRFMAQNGAEHGKSFDDLQTITRRVLAAAHTLSALWARDHFRTKEQREAHYDRVEKYEAIFWNMGGDEDSIKAEIQAVVSKFEDSCRKIISRK